MPDTELVQQTLIEALKIIATVAIPYIALLRTRADLDRFAAAQRAKESGRALESELRRKWYSRYFKKRLAPKVGELIESPEDKQVIQKTPGD